MSNDALYRKSDLNQIGGLGKLASDAAKAFVQFDEKAIAEGELSVKR